MDASLMATVKAICNTCIFEKADTWAFNSKGVALSTLNHEFIKRQKQFVHNHPLKFNSRIEVHKW